MGWDADCVSTLLSLHYINDFKAHLNPVLSPFNLKVYNKTVCVSNSVAWLWTCLVTGLAFWKDSEAYGHSSPMRSLKELVIGS